MTHATIGTVSVHPDCVVIIGGSLEGRSFEPDDPSQDIVPHLVNRALQILDGYHGEAPPPYKDWPEGLIVKVTEDGARSYYGDESSKPLLGEILLAKSVLLSHQELLPSQE